MDMANKTRAREVLSKSLLVADTANPCIRVKYTDVSKDASSPKPYCNLIITNNGSSASKLIVKLRIGASASVYDEYQFSYSGVVVANSSATTVTNYTATTIAKLIENMNIVDGVYACRVDAPADLSTDSDDWIDNTGLRLSPIFVNTLYRDTSELATYACRIAIPEDAFGAMGNGMIEIVSVYALVDNAGNSATAVTMTISKDPSESASDEVLLLGKVIPDNAWTELFDFTKAPLCVKGPILLELTSATGTGDVANGRIVFNYRSAEY